MLPRSLLGRAAARGYVHCSAILTSKLPFTRWASTLADGQTLTAAMLGRLPHHAQVVLTSGDSYWLNDKRRAATLGAPMAS